MGTGGCSGASGERESEGGGGVVVEPIGKREPGRWMGAFQEAGDEKRLSIHLIPQRKSDQCVVTTTRTPVEQIQKTTQKY